ncbi:hypothetical protein TWF730_004160 [Orbilia blumenaviensis]|uniref:UEV-domain-containing protein n=1 Tax=Orbilia blumenaviensis TaxID=1796055 RepID=A0AAV9TZ38_9PEZI
MAELAPELLRWLSTVLAPKYAAAGRTYTDTATLLHHHRSLAPKTDVYTYDDGRSDLLLCIHGTLPVGFRGATYNIPLNIWVPHQYPNTPPTVMVVPGKNMGIRPTNHVDTNGRCYHPYLAYWAQNPDKSTLLDLCGQLKDVFSKEPPLYSKQAPPPPQVTTAAAPGTPPPRPPLPQEIEAQRARTAAANQPAAAEHAATASPPPPPPPKADPRQQSPAAYSYTTTPHLFLPQNQAAPQPVASPPQNNNHHNPPPPDRPALPQKLPREEPRPAAYPVPSPAYQQTAAPPPPPPPPPVPPIPSPIRNAALESRSPPPPPHSPYHHPSPPPVIHPQHGWHSPPPPPQIPLQSHPHRLSGQLDPINRFPIINHQINLNQRPMSIHGYPTQPSNLNPQQQQQQLQPLQQPLQPSKLPQRSQSQRTPINILDDDNGITPSKIPSSSTPSSSTIPPPLPRNPEKDRLITQISQILQQKAEAAASRTAASLEQTTSQAEAMAKTEAYMERERIELIRINDVCEKDQRILNERIAMADELIREVAGREAPNIDGVVVAPTVVHNQLYELVTDDMAIEDTIYVLGKALDKERITLDVFLKHTRALAREQFMKRALVGKISRQIGMT